MTTAGAADGRPGGRGGPTFWVGAGVGGALVAFGLAGLLREVGPGVGSELTWLVGGALAVDLLVVPIAAVVGLAGRAAVPGWAWPAVRFGLVATAALVAFALPLVAGWGGAPGNPTVRPRPYGWGLAVAVAVTWLVAGAWALVSGVGARRRA